jgi:tetratricopeptide (TPR) repeat protein
MGQHGAAVSLLKRAAELDPSNFALMNPGLIHLDGGVPDTAIEYFRSAAALAPQNPVIKGYEALATRDLGSPHLVAERLPIIRDLSRAVKAEQPPLRTDAATSVSFFGRAYGAATYHRMDVEAP